MISRVSINYSGILIMERNLQLFADPVNYCFKEEVFRKGDESWSYLAFSILAE
jgi:hypothetical protein